MQIAFKIAAVVLLGAAAFLWWQKSPEYAFICGVLSACAYFLGMRFEMKARINKQKAEIEKEAESSPAEDAGPLE